MLAHQSSLVPKDFQRKQQLFQLRYTWKYPSHEHKLRTSIFKLYIIIEKSRKWKWMTKQHFAATVFCDCAIFIHEWKGGGGWGIWRTFFPRFFTLSTNFWNCFGVKNDMRGSLKKCQSSRTMRFTKIPNH